MHKGGIYNDMARHGTKIFFALCIVLALFLAVFASQGALQVMESAKASDAQAENAFVSSDILAESSDPALKAGFVPHKALYDIKLSGKKSGSQIVNIAGQMMYEWESGCQGWTANHKFNLIYEYADSPPMRITSDFSTYELFDGGSFNFVAQRKRDGEIFEELRGNAKLVENGAGEIAFRVPPDVTYELPAGSLFPMQHTLAVQENIRAGKKFFNATIFDGSDQDGPVEINAFIGGKELDGAKIAPKGDEIDAALLDTKAQEVRLAFFPLSNQEAGAEYEMSLVFHENGIISDMNVDYNDFSVTQKLVALEAKPLGDLCGAGKEGAESN